MTSQLKMPRNKSRSHSNAFYVLKILAVARLQYRHNVLPDAEDTGGHMHHL